MMGLITEEQEAVASITGGYTVPPSNCDALHSFEKLGKMNSKVNAKLMELYRILFNEEFTGAHDAMADVTATMKCFFELKKRGVM